MDLCDKCIYKRTKAVPNHNKDHRFKRVFGIDEDDVDLNLDVDKLDNFALELEIEKVRAEIARLEERLGGPALLRESKGEEEELEVEAFEIPEHCIPIRTDVRAFDWQVPPTSTLSLLMKCFFFG